MKHSADGYRPGMVKHQRNCECAHIGNAMFVAGDKEAEHEENHGKHLRSISLKGQRNEEGKTDEPVTEDGAEEQLPHRQIHFFIHDTEQERVDRRLRK
ncbi:hypothetical protein D3C84_1012730 [compost metagenome]